MFASSSTLISFSFKPISGSFVDSERKSVVDSYFSFAKQSVDHNRNVTVSSSPSLSKRISAKLSSRRSLDTICHVNEEVIKAAAYLKLILLVGQVVK